jgi:predicted nucleotidyltransferase component of viral defense system
MDRRHYAAIGEKGRNGTGMRSFLAFSEDRKRLVCEQAQDKLGLPPATIEKDFWVCWTLKKLFELPEWGERVTFKGGTSLSKGWSLIKRFSEDIDIVINRSALGFGDEKAPDRAPSKKQLYKRLDNLKEASQQCVNNILLPLLRDSISKEMPPGLSWELDSSPYDPDRQTLLLRYPTVFAGQMVYLGQEVKIELGARSDTDPTLDITIHPYLAEAFPDLFVQSDFPVKAVSPERTFWEKAMLLHEETFRKPEKRRQARMARHYYDLYYLIEAGVGQKASQDLGLFARIATHRQVYFRQNWVDYDTLKPGSLRLVPTEDQISDWRSDYAAMKDEMFFDKPPAFDELIERIREFQDIFNKIVES